MKVSYNWLKQWIDLDQGPEAVAAALTMAGLEVDEVTPVAAPLDGVVVGRVAGVEAHPDADRLRVCSVDSGTGEALTIVCGAPNVRPGMKVALATVGTRLPGGLEIKPARLRGVASEGMLCSAPELGLGEDASGLLELPDDAPVGEPLERFLGLDDHVLEVDLTPNRADCLSVRGLARDLGAITDRNLRIGPAEPVAATTDRTFPVRLAAPADCPRYVGRVIEGVDLAAATPVWMVERLRRAGLRSLHPAVDVTNYVLLELGQPLHAFDLDKLDQGIHVRRASAGEHLVLLDGQRAELDGDMLVIADQAGPVALAGIMGGQSTAVDTGTSSIFLESAWFNPATIMGRSRRLGLATESAHRFERGVDPELQAEAVERATGLLLEIAGGRPGPLVDVCQESHLPAREPVRLRLERVNRLLGTDLEARPVRRILERLGMTMETVEPEGPGACWSVTAPSARQDIAIEADLIEEVARIHGYNRLPERRPGGRLIAGTRPERRRPETALRNTLTGRGFHEIITWSFVSRRTLEAIGLDAGAQPLANPLSRDMGVLRTTLLAGLLETAGANLRRQHARLRLFELGTCFEAGEDAFREPHRLGLLLAGPAAREHWDAGARKVDFFDLKGEVESLVGHSPGAAWEFLPPGERSGPAPAHLHPGQAARVFRAERAVGWLGQLHPGLVRELDLPAPVFIAELDLEPVLERALPRFRPLPRFPAVRRDLSLLVPAAVTAESLIELVRESAGESLRETVIFDRYHGKGIEPGYESLAIGLIFQSLSATLKDSEVDARVSRVVDALKTRLQVELRG